MVKLSVHKLYRPLTLKDKGKYVQLRDGRIGRIYDFLEEDEYPIVVRTNKEVYYKVSKYGRVVTGKTYPADIVAVCKEIK